MTLALIVSFIFICFFFFMYQDQDSRLDKFRADAKPQTLSVAILLILTIAKIPIAPFFAGYESDMNTYTAWMQKAAKGLNNFYSDGYFCDYPPLYIMMTGFLGWIRNFFGESQYFTLLFVKLPGIVAEGLLGYELLKCYSQYYPAKKHAPFACMLALLPSFLITSTFWGQTDAVFCYLMFLAIRFILEDKLELCALWFTLAALMKPQSFLFAPLFAILFIKSDEVIILGKLKKGLSWKKPFKAIWNCAVTLVCALLVMSICMMPFRGGIPDLPFLISKYIETFSSYPYASLNTFNLFALLGGNLADIKTNFLFLTYEIWGTIFLGLSVLGAVAAVWFNREKKNLWLILATYLLAVVMLGAKMHERYWFFVPLLVLAHFIVNGKKKHFGMFCGLQISYFLNLFYALLILNDISDTATDIVFVLCTIFNLSILVYLILETVSQIRLQYPLRAHKKHEYTVKGGWKSVAAVLAVMLVFSLSAFYRLGSFDEFPQTRATLTPGQEVTFDFGDFYRLSEVKYFVGYGLKNYNLFYAEELNTKWFFDFSGSYTKQPYVFSWQSEKLDNELARYVVLKLLEENTDPVTEWGEFRFYDENGEEIPFTVIAPEGVDVSAFSDEPECVPENPSYYNSFYFDEIYHGRTAYEYQNNLTIYEITHPPLGKLLITVGLSLFGTNLFGFRFMGVLFGILTIVFIFLLFKKLLKYWWIAILATILYTVDFMHLSHTRIASIDSFSVFFIVASFYFMTEFITCYKECGNTGKSMLFLGLSGAMFGCAAAVKWTGIYAGFGLLLLYLYAIVTRYRAQKKGKEIGVLLASSLVLYLIVPFAIYYFSYFNYFDAFQKPFNFSNFWEAQQTMFSYHSGLEETHPYSAAWYHWIVDLRPLWMFTGSELASGNVETIATFGNPVVIWFGLASLISTAVICVRQKRLPLCAYVIFCGFFAQLIPWVFVTRVTFFYHYFPMIPFLVLAVGFCWNEVIVKSGKSLWYPALVTTVAVVMFGLFYPVLTGVEVSPQWVEFLKLIPSWIF